MSDGESDPRLPHARAGWRKKKTILGRAAMFADNNAVRDTLQAFTPDRDPDESLALIRQGLQGICTIGGVRQGALLEAEKPTQNLPQVDRPTDTKAPQASPPDPKYSYAVYVLREALPREAVSPVRRLHTGLLARGLPQLFEYQQAGNYFSCGFDDFRKACGNYGVSVPEEWTRIVEGNLSTSPNLARLEKERSGPKKKRSSPFPDEETPDPEHDWRPDTFRKEFLEKALADGKKWFCVTYPDAAACLAAKNTLQGSARHAGLQFKQSVRSPAKIINDGRSIVIALSLLKNTICPNLGIPLSEIEAVESRTQQRQRKESTLVSQIELPTKGASSDEFRQHFLDFAYAIGQGAQQRLAVNYLNEKEKQRVIGILERGAGITFDNAFTSPARIEGQNRLTLTISVPEVEAICSRIGIPSAEVKRAIARPQPPSHSEERIM